MDGSVHLNSFLGIVWNGKIVYNRRFCSSLSDLRLKAVKFWTTQYKHSFYQKKIIRRRKWCWTWKILPALELSPNFNWIFICATMNSCTWIKWILVTYFIAFLFFVLLKKFIISIKYRYLCDSIYEKCMLKISWELCRRLTR